MQETKEREHHTFFQYTEIVDLLKQYFEGSLLKREALDNFRKPALLKAMCCQEQEFGGTKLSSIVAYEDVAYVSNRLVLTPVFVDDSIIYGFYLLALEYAVGRKKHGDPDTELYPVPTMEQKITALDVFQYYLDERLFGQIKCPARINSEVIPAPIESNIWAYKQRLLEFVASKPDLSQNFELRVKP